MDKPLSGLRILVVEDEIIIVLMIEGILSDLGCSSVVSAPSASKALALIDEQRFDVATLDMNLGGGGSNAIAEALALRGVPFVYCTGNREANDVKGDLERMVLRKPFSAEELATALSHILHSDSPTRA